MQKLIRAYFKFSSRAPTLITTCIGTFMFLLLVFPSLPIGGPILDIQTGYTYTQAIEFLTMYGESGRRLYAWASPTIDTVFPAIYVTFFCGLLYRFPIAQGLWIVAYLPIIAGIVDLAENVQITTMLIQFPDISSEQVSIASLFTTTKTYLGYAYQSLAALSLVIAALRYLAGRVEDKAD